MSTGNMVPNRVSGGRRINPFGIFSASPQISDQERISASTHRPYRYGMALLCLGGLLNWIGLFENYAEPVRYVGVGCVVAGAALLCFALCCWLRPHPDPGPQSIPSSASCMVGVGGGANLTQVTVVGPSSKPPDYEAVADPPPSYEDAIKLSPARLLWIQETPSRQMTPAPR